METGIVMARVLAAWLAGVCMTASAAGPQAQVAGLQVRNTEVLTQFIRPQAQVTGLQTLDNRRQTQDNGLRAQRDGLPVPEVGTGSKPTLAAGEDDRIWTEFVALVQAGGFPGEKVAPYREELRQPLLGFLETMRVKADWKEWRAEREVIRAGDQVHFLLPLTFDGATGNYCFSFAVRDGAWFFQHLEAITLRLDRLGPLPARGFPDLPEPDKAWIREELQVSRDVWLLNSLAAEKGREAALEWFRDGAGYALAARSWVPYATPREAFILYLCWEQANLRGSDVVLERLDAERAIVRLRPLCFALYEKAAHLEQQIRLEDFRALFEFRWQDRARSAGWDLRISYEGGDCVLEFTRPAP